MLNLEKISTERRNPNTMNLDTMTPLELVTVMNCEDEKTVLAVRAQLGQIAKCAESAIDAISGGGRIIYMGAGTSGRLGVLDAAECPPTFGVSGNVVVGLMAGGEGAFTKAAEGAEDDRSLGKRDLAAIGLVSRDMVIGIAASGRTPYVLGGLEYARKKGCRTAAVTCSPGSEVGAAAEISIEVLPGPEVLTGSTRLKAGTCQKLILNMISTAAMVGCGKAYENLMVDVMQTNEKLVTRAQNIVMEAAGVDRDTAREKLLQADGSCKVAITMSLAHCGAEEAVERLKKAGGRVRQAIK